MDKTRNRCRCSPFLKQRKDAYRASNKNSGAESRKIISHKKADILLVTVTEMETQALLNCFPSAEKHIVDQVYYDFGSIGLARTVMVRSTHMGPFSAIRCVEKGIDHFSPHTVIMVGIAFGLHPHEQKIGDILVAQQIMNWDFQKIHTGPDNEPVILPRGTAIPVADRLLNCFQASQLEWMPPPHIHIGPILSSSRLIDHEGTRDELLRSFPEAIGGEMEGHGLCDACSHKKVDWILVKAICDWADGNKGENKESHQRVAAGNAAHFVLSVIKQYGLL
jgi:nucleoside phosphorylase